MVVLAAVIGPFSAAGCGAIRDNEEPFCRYGGPTVLMSEAIPTASMVPCMRSVPLGWRFGRFQARNGLAWFSLDSDVAGKGALRVQLSRSCRTGSAQPEKSDEAGAELFASADRWVYLFPGGCVVYDVTLPRSRAPVLERQIRSSASFLTRRWLDETMRSRTGRGLDVPNAGS